MEYKAAIISLGSESSKMTLRAMQKYFGKVDHLNLKSMEVNLGTDKPEILCEGKPIEDYDCIYAKGSFRYAPLLQAITSILSETTYMPVCSNAFWEAHNKNLTQLSLQKKNIPMPRTYLTSSINAARSILDKINYPIIMKFPQGTQGKGVMFAESKASASSMMDALQALKQPFLIQEYIDTGGVDIRALVVGGEVVASMKRKAVQGEERANIHAGGKGEACILDYATKKIAVDAAKALGADICGVDILEGVKGSMVIEINISPGLQGITSATKINVADKIAQFLFEKTKEIKSTGTSISAKEILEDLQIEGKASKQEIITSLDFRGRKILLPEIVSKMTNFNEEDEVVIKAKDKHLEISKFKIG